MEGILFPRGVVAGQEGLEEYRARSGYKALTRAVKTTPEGIIKEVSDAALRGRGGAGFPTGKKWSFTRERPEQPRYLVLNGGEDEPGSKKDRLLMENLPHLVIEGVIIAAYAIVWLGLCIYLAVVMLRIRGVRTELAAVEELVREHEQEKA